jgi:DNA polymerase-3 subunit delta'
MKFAEIVGHKELKQRLIDHIQHGRISHAQLYIGNEGAGTLALALAYFQFLCCENKGLDDSCGECSSCKKHQKFIHPDLHFVFPTNTVEKKMALSNDFLVEWRSFLMRNPYQNLFDWLEEVNISNKQGSINVDEADQIIKKLNLRPFESKYKMMIIWMAEKMNVHAANKILKILEEPEGNTVFILITENLDELLPTIISRTQTIKVSPYKTKEIENFLINKNALSTDVAKDIANISDGNFRTALELINEEREGYDSNLEMYKIWMRYCYSQKIQELLIWTDETSKIGRENQKNFLQYALKNIRDNLALTIQAAETVKTTQSEREFSTKFHQFIHPKNAALIYDEITKAHSDIKRNVNGKMVLLDLSLRLCGHLRINAN